MEDILRFNVGMWLHNTNTKPGPCGQFINGTSKAAVALASFPASGNTWVSGLLEKATGVCTDELVL